jgi:Zn-dependent protease
MLPDWRFFVSYAIAVCINMAILWIIMVIHEAGHALACLALGEKFKLIRIGQPYLFTVKIGNVEIDIGLFPFKGAVEGQSPEIKWHKLVPILMSGSALNIIAGNIALLLIMASGYHFDVASLEVTFQGLVMLFVIFNYLVALSNLMPLPKHDGYLILKLLKKHYFS